jgi:hypothetical protein
MSQLDDPLLLGIASRIIRCIRLEDSKRVIRELWVSRFSKRPGPY